MFHVDGCKVEIPFPYFLFSIPVYGGESNVYLYYISNTPSFMHGWQLMQYDLMHFSSYFIVLTFL